MDDNLLKDLVTVFKGDITPGALKVWLSQFAPDDIPYIIPLVQRFKYYSSLDVFALLDVLFHKLKDKYNIDEENSWFVPSGYVAKSGDAIAYFFRRRNRLPDNAFLRSSDLDIRALEQRRSVIFLDDFIGSGQVLLRTAAEVVAPLKATVPSAQFIFAAIVGYRRGILRIGANDALQICTSEIVEEAEEPFNEVSTVFPDVHMRRKAEDVVRKYTERLSPRSPMGYGGSQGLVAFFFGTPNNTLPIFWRNTSNWQPLLPHGDSLRDPRRVIEVPGHPPRISDKSGMAVGHESVEGLSLSKEATAALFDGFQTLQNMGVAAQAMAQAAFSDAAIREIVSAIQMLEEDVHEGEPVCTAFLCASPERLTSLLTDCFVKFEPGISLVDEPTLRAAAQLVNGFDGALLLSSTGHVHGAMIYPPAQALKDPFLPARFHKVAAAAIRANGFVVLFAGGGRVVILDRGVRVLTRRFAKWHLQGIPSRLREIEAEHGLVRGLLNHALKLAFALADAGCGAILTLGDADRVAAFAGKLPPAMFKWQGLSLSRDDLLPLLFLARQDGATVVTENGIVKTTMTILQPPADVKADEEADRGARHTTASKISSATAALTIAVSEDGTITLYSKGGRILRVMG